MVSLYKKYSHGIWLLYFPLYLLVFSYLEKTNVRGLHRVTSFLDYHIPFCEWFIIPYLLWFAYIAVTVTYLFFHNVSEFRHCMRFLCAGMTIFLIVSAVYPTVQDLRPVLPASGSILTDLVRHLYQVDTPTNVFPSIHVFNSIGAYIAVCRVKPGKHNLGFRLGCLVLTVSIILATMFLKQHSVIDVIGGIALAYLCYYLIYCRDVSVSRKQSKVLAR